MSVDFSAESEDFCRRVIELLSRRRETLAVAESCTGGMISAALTHIPGSSAVLWGGVVSYSNEAKSAYLDVDPALILREGAVSGAVAKAMAWGMRVHSGADRTLAVTGIAGPGGGTPEKPVGTVWIGETTPDGRVEACLHQFEGDRASVRNQTLRAALGRLLKNEL